MLQHIPVCNYKAAEQWFHAIAAAVATAAPAAAPSYPKLNPWKLSQTTWWKLKQKFCLNYGISYFVYCSLSVPKTTIYYDTILTNIEYMKICQIPQFTLPLYKDVLGFITLPNIIHCTTTCAPEFNISFIIYSWNKIYTIYSHWIWYK